MSTYHVLIIGDLQRRGLLSLTVQNAGHCLCCVQMFTRSPVAKAEISVSCREGPCTHICCCSADCGFLGLLVYKFYGTELKQMFGYEERPYAFYTLAALSIVLVGLLYRFFIAIICGQRINERHYNVLAKQELTNEYIVEDRDKMGIPELDPSHVSELRTLGLY